MPSFSLSALQVKVVGNITKNGFANSFIVLRIVFSFLRNKMHKCDAWRDLVPFVQFK